MSRKTAYIGSLAIGAVAFMVAKVVFPHDGIGGEIFLLGFPFWVMVLEMALLGKGGE